jgi:hypothetical protein
MEEDVKPVRSKVIVGIAIGMVWLFSTFSVAGSVPTVLGYQGKLTNSSGQAFTGSFDFTFKLFNDASTGSPLWSEQQQEVTVNNGLYSVLLGTNPANAINLPFDTPYWLEITVKGETLQPRQLLAVGPYAVHSEFANTAVTVAAGVLADGVKVSTASIIATGTAKSGTFLSGDGTWGTPPSATAAAIGAGTLNNNVVVTTGSINASGTANSTTFLRGDSVWFTPPSATAASLGAGTIADTVRVSSASVIATGVAGSGTFLRGDASWSGVSASAIGAGTLNNNVVVTTGSINASGTASSTTFLRGDSVWFTPPSATAASLGAGTIADTVRVSSASVIATGVAGSGTFLRGDASWSGVSASAIGAGTLNNNVVITTGSINASGTASNATFLRGDSSWGTPPSATASAIGAGTLSDSVRVSSSSIIASGTAGNTVFLRGDASWSGVTASNIGAGTLNNNVVVTTGSIHAGTLPDAVRVSSASIIATGTAGSGTFLRGDGSWNTPVPSGSTVLLYADESEATGTSDSSAAKTYTVPANSYSYILAEAEVVVESYDGSQSTATFKCMYNGTQEKTMVLSQKGNGSGDINIAGATLKHSKILQSNSAISIDVSFNSTGNGRWRIKGFRIYGVY